MVTENSSKLPLLVEPEQLNEILGQEGIVIIDLSLPAIHKQEHIPGAIWLSYPSIVFAHDNVDCDIPSEESLTETLSALGIKPTDHVVAYDSQGCPMAARLLWTLEEIGHKNFSLLNGGLSAWKAAGLPLETETHTLPESNYVAKYTYEFNATKDHILEKLHDKNVALIDNRMEEEFTNELLICDRGGNIPGAIHFDWMNAVNEDDHMRMKDADEIRAKLTSLGVTEDREIIVYCQTHFRSAYVYMMLKILGYSNVKGYAAGYAEWGNEEDTPIENEFIDEDDDLVQACA